MTTNQVVKIRQSSRQIIQELGFLDNKFSKIGSLSQCHALYELKNNKLLSGTQLGKLLNLEKSSVSRLIKSLMAKDLCQYQLDPSDSRVKLVALTTKGKEAANYINEIANQQVADALSLLDKSERQQVLSGLYLYSKALKQSRMQAQYTIRPLTKEDIPAIITITKNTWVEFGFDSNHPNSNIYESDLNDLMDFYIQKKQDYFVIELDNIIVGGGGFRQIGPPKDKVCELQNMYFSSEVRGLGLGSLMLTHLIRHATDKQYNEVYLETMDFMHRANALYINKGFTLLEKPRYNTGHVWTNRWYVKKLPH